MNDIDYNLKNERKVFSRIGFALSAILVVAFVTQAFCVVVPKLIWGENNWFSTSSWGFWILNFAPIYLFAIPTGLLIMRKIPAQEPEEHKLGIGKFLILLPIVCFITYSGNIIGNVLSIILSGGQAKNALLDYAMDNNPLKIIVMVVLAPILEEFVFRKQLIDRTRCYGEKLTVLLSGLTFGLLHQNLFQFFYAFGIGVVFAYIYLRTGKLRYTVLMHAILNFMGAVIAPWIISLVDLDAISSISASATNDEIIALLPQILPGLIIFMLYAFLLMAISIAGLVLLIVFSRKIVWKPAESQLPQGEVVKTVYKNIGMILYIILCAVFIVISLLM